MVNINLLPEKVRAAETLKIVVALGVLSLSLPILFWAYRYAGAKAELASVEKQIDAVNADLNSPQLRHIVEEVEQFGRDRADLDSKRSVVDLLRKRQVTLVRLLDVMPELVPRRAWLTRFEVRDDDKDKSVKKGVVEGMAASAEVLADFYANLEANPAIRKPQMDTAPSLTTAMGKQAISFKMSFQIEDQL